MQWRAHEHGVEPSWCDTWRASCCSLHVCTKSHGVMHDSWLLKVAVLNCRGAGLDGLRYCQLLRDCSMKLVENCPSESWNALRVHCVSSLACTSARLHGVTRRFCFRDEQNVVGSRFLYRRLDIARKQRLLNVEYERTGSAVPKRRHIVCIGGR